MNEKPTTVYRCEGCGEVYDSLDYATECCAPDVIEVRGWDCAECGEFYDNKERAHLCCWDEESELEPFVPTQEEMEAAGQMRLSV